MMLSSILFRVFFRQSYVLKIRRFPLIGAAFKIKPAPGTFWFFWKIPGQLRSEALGKPFFFSKHLTAANLSVPTKHDEVSGAGFCFTRFTLVRYIKNHRFAMLNLKIVAKKARRDQATGDLPRRAGLHNPAPRSSWEPTGGKGQKGLKCGLGSR
jgi:hypothetical protein